MYSKSSAISIRDVLAGLLILIIGMAGVGGHRLKRIYGVRIVASERVSVYIATPGSIEVVVNRLVSKGAWVDRTEFLWAAGILRYRSTKVGHYSFEGALSYAEVLRRVSAGMQDPIRLTVLPGIDRITLVESVSARLSFPAESLQAVLNDRSFLAKHGATPASVIGRLWPDTYSFYWTATPETIVSTMLSTFSSKTDGLDFSRSARMGLSNEQVITLASIVEWESKDAEERRLVAGLYLNRLKKGMRLQADPTVAFAIGSRRRLTFDDYKYEHPYNTYRIDGLPPGPINNPSLSSIKAALDPVQHNYIYMVASPTGKHVFTSSWAEHKVESEKWRRWLRQQYRLKEAKEKSD